MSTTPRLASALLVVLPLLLPRHRPPPLHQLPLRLALLAPLAHNSSLVPAQPTPTARPFAVASSLASALRPSSPRSVTEAVGSETSRPTTLPPWPLVAPLLPQVWTTPRLDNVLPVVLLPPLLPRRLLLLLLPHLRLALARLPAPSSSPASAPTMASARPPAALLASAPPVLSPLALVERDAVLVLPLLAA